MGLVEIFLGTLCLNASCLIDDQDDYTAVYSQKKALMVQLAGELKDQNLIVSTVNNDRLSGVKTENGTLIGTGVAFDLLNILQDKFKFSYSVTTPTYGFSSKNSILNMLKTGKANVSAAFLPVLTEYTDLISYSPSMDTGEWVVLMKRPGESATGSGLLAPFTLSVWMLILLSLVVVGPVIYFIIYVQAKLCKNEESKIFSMQSCIWFVYGALLKQGTTLNPMTDSSRLLFSTWWIFITILTAFYTANLTAFLTLSKFTLPISDPQEIKKYSWVTTKGNALEDTVTTDTDELTDLGKIIGNARYYLDYDDNYILKEYVEKENLMFIREKPVVEYVMYDDYKEKTKAQIKEEKRCTYVITKWPVVTFSRAFAYARHFKYKPLFDSTIQYLVESGIIKYKLREQLPDTQICPLNLGNKERQLRNSDLLMTYEIVGGGFIISLVIFMVEMVIQSCKKDTYANLINGMKMKNSKTFGLNDKFGQISYTPKFITPPPSYQTLFNVGYKNDNVKKKNINGREYWVYDALGKDTKMVPLRTPSALLFQYAN